MNAELYRKKLKLCGDKNEVEKLVEALSILRRLSKSDHSLLLNHAQSIEVDKELADELPYLGLSYDSEKSTLRVCELHFAQSLEWLAGTLLRGARIARFYQCVLPKLYLSSYDDQIAFFQLRANQVINQKETVESFFKISDGFQDKKESEDEG